MSYFFIADFSLYRDATFPFLNGFPFFFTKPKNSVFF